MVLQAQVDSPLDFFPMELAEDMIDLVRAYLK
jgi:hypothetical protein